jgi:hypothetical protein
VIDPNEHLKTALGSHVCMVDHSRHMVLDVMFQPKFLLGGLLQQGFQCFLMFLRIVPCELFCQRSRTRSRLTSIKTICSKHKTPQDQIVRLCQKPARTGFFLLKTVVLDILDGFLHTCLLGDMDQASTPFSSIAFLSLAPRQMLGHQLIPLSVEIAC